MLIHILRNGTWSSKIEYEEGHNFTHSCESKWAKWDGATMPYMPLKTTPFIYVRSQCLYALERNLRIRNRISINIQPMRSDHIVKSHLTFQSDTFHFDRHLEIIPLLNLYHQLFALMLQPKTISFTQIWNQQTKPNWRGNKNWVLKPKRNQYNFWVHHVTHSRSSSSLLLSIFDVVSGVK